MDFVCGDFKAQKTLVGWVMNGAMHIGSDDDCGEDS